ncbi:unnamed protein product [Prunus armeniaca]
MKIERVAGRIPEAKGSSQKILISVDGLLGQKYYVIKFSPLPMSSIPWKKPINLVRLLHCPISHFIGGK